MRKFNYNPFTLRALRVHV